MATEYARALGGRLRAIRKQQGLSLQGVEEKSEGLWKAVVIGSYERGDRAVTVAKLAQLADFYGVPVSVLLPGGAASASQAPPTRVVMDLEKLANVPPDKSGPLNRYLSAIQAQRGDYNGRVLTVRSDDLRTLAVIYDTTPGVLAEELIAWGVLNADAAKSLEQ